MKTFKKWLYSEGAGKNLLILIHPDCVSELGDEACSEYSNKIKNYTSRFDYIISHLFWPKNVVEDRANRSGQRNVALDEIIATVRSVSDVVTPQNGPKDCTYNRELPDYLINNENVNVFMAGGYEDNCLWHSYIDLFEKLGWLLRERNISVQWYSPLIFQAKDKELKPRDDDEVALHREKPELAKDRAVFGNFDRRKVDYGEPI